jgi:uncharacterized protein (DUF1015 family)
LLCPPYDVITPEQREDLLASDPDNAVAIVLPGEPTAERPDPYAAAAQRLERQVDSGLYAVDERAALYVYEMTDAAGAVTRGLLGAVELRDPADGVILPHENTMAGPVADRLALMTATEANVEPIYLVYDGGGAASEIVSAAHHDEPVAEAHTPDGVRHRLWAITDPDVHDTIASDLAGRRALIADGHHRYATYREMQQRFDAARGAGPWDRGLTLLVDSTSYGPQVHAIHRVVPGLDFATAVAAVGGPADVASDFESPEAGLKAAEGTASFAVVLTDGRQTALITDPAGTLRAAASRPGEPPALAELDVTVLHRVLVEGMWRVPDTAERVGYAHSVEEALGAARAGAGVAVLLRPTPVGAVAAVAAAGARMPRKSTLFTPKPASGLVMRRFRDEIGAERPQDPAAAR